MQRLLGDLLWLANLEEEEKKEKKKNLHEFRGQAIPDVAPHPYPHPHPTHTRARVPPVGLLEHRAVESLTANGSPCGK